MVAKRHPVQSSKRPTLPRNVEVLILGSVPGEKTLKARQKNNNDEYYSNEDNAFWDLIQIKYSLEPNFKSRDYEYKKKILEKHKIGLWDIISYCTREGSRDITINLDEAEYNNDIAACIDNNPSIKRILLNGKNKKEMLNKYMERNNIKIKIEVIDDLWSTSAGDKMPFSEIKKWLMYLPD